MALRPFRLLGAEERCPTQSQLPTDKSPARGNWLRQVYATGLRTLLHWTGASRLRKIVLGTARRDWAGRRVCLLELLGACHGG